MEPDAVQPGRAQLEAWTVDCALPLKGVEAGIGFDDLVPLREWIDDARVVGLGEATHVQSEFFLLKHRMFEFLVSELDFNLFVIEAPLPQSLAINHYVLTGEGDARHSLASMPHFIWNCEEVAGLIEWMRAWNAEHERKLFFYGCDPTVSAPAAMYLLDFLKRQYGSAYRRHRDALLPLATDAHFSDWVLRSETEMAEARTAIDEVIGTLAELGADSPAGQYELGLARLQAATLSQHHEWWSVPGLEGPQRMAIRDRSMAENTAALLALHGSNAKAAVWAHNNHIQLQSGRQLGLTEPPLGQHLRAIFGERYLSFGLCFDHGSFRIEGKDQEMRDVTVVSAPGTLEATLGEVGPPLCALNLRGIPTAVEDELGSAPPRVLGDSLEDKPPAAAKMSDLFDAVLFVRETTASLLRPDRSYPDEAGREYPPASAGLLNLDFAQGTDHWRRFPYPSSSGYSVAANCGQLAISRSESLWPSDVFALSQTVSAEPWRGRRVSLRCQVGMVAAHEGSSAQLALRIGQRSGESDRWVPATYYRRAAWHRVLSCDAATQELSLTTAVDVNADVLDIALLMIGDGRAQFGPVIVEPDPLA